MKIQNQTSGSFETGSSSAHSPVVASSIFPPNRPVFKPSKPMECTVKITKASLKQASSGKPEFRFQAQIFIEAREDTANVTYLNSMVQSKWGPEYMIVTADGLPIQDSAATKGTCVLIIQ